METRPTKPTSLTAWLERAAAARTQPSVLQEPPKVVRVDPVDDVNRCTASVVSGQACRRPALAGDHLCAGHAAMAGTQVDGMRAR